MKLMIASDIHGSAAWCRRLLEAMEQEAPAKLVLLGDLLYHGPRNSLPEGYDPQDTAAQLNQIRERLVCVRGNCEAEVDQMMLRFPVLADYALLFTGTRTIFATHGHRFHAEALPNLSQGDMLLYGHTHVPLFAERDGIFCVNPGSVSIPKEGSRHSYLILENDLLIWKDLGRDSEAVRTERMN